MGIIRPIDSFVDDGDLVVRDIQRLDDVAFRVMRNGNDLLSLPDDVLEHEIVGDPLIRLLHPPSWIE